MTEEIAKEKRRTEFVFKCEMKPCPECGHYKMRYQTPIVMAEEIEAGDGARQILRKYARSVKSGATKLQGPVFLMCWSCGHKGPAMDCSGRTSEDVGKDPAVATEVKRLWNSQ
jgi:hypothetical protein